MLRNFSIIFSGESTENRGSMRVSVPTRLPIKLIKHNGQIKVCPTSKRPRSTLSEKIRFFEHMKKADFFEGMSRVAATVSILTTNGTAGYAGLTVSSMSSVSAEPPTLLVCVNMESPSSKIIEKNGVFCINVLRTHHVSISEQFAGLIPFDEALTFSSDEWSSSPSGSPRFNDALVSFDCRIIENRNIGSHMVFYGGIEDVSISDGQPLIYLNRGYLQL